MAYQLTQNDCEEPKKEEPLFEVLSNPARVMRPQLQVISMEDPAKCHLLKMSLLLTLPRKDENKGKEVREGHVC